MSLIEQFETRYLLGVPAMDATHREFVALVNDLGASTGDAFTAGFGDLVAHTRAHFAGEDALMTASGFPALSEHRDEHARVLGELERLLERVERGRPQMARAYVAEQLPGWFALHAATMDSALAAHLQRKG